VYEYVFEILLLELVPLLNVEPPDVLLLLPELLAFAADTTVAVVCVLVDQARLVAPVVPLYVPSPE
jgi:hypothetical protein